MAGKIIQIPFHIGDFLTGTIHMDAREIGAYWMLCVAHYQAGPQGLPDDNQQLARIAKVTPHIWTKIRPVIEAKFIVKDGFWTHNRVKEVLKNVSHLQKKNSAKSLKRWRTGYAAAMPRQCQPTKKGITKYNNKPPISPFEEKKDNHDGYAYVGSVVKLKEADWDKWIAMTGLDDKQLLSVLVQRDAWLAQQDEVKQKSWFVSTSRYLQSNYGQ